MRLSHSRIDKYHQCPRKYHYYYNEKLRSKFLGSALFYGNIIGDTVQMVALSKKSELTEEESNIVNTDPYEYFDKLMATVEINGVGHKLPTSPLVRYFKSDYDELLLKAEDLQLIREYGDEIGMRGIAWGDLWTRYYSRDLDEEEFSYMNFMFWLSCRRRGHMMIAAYINEVMPRIKEVHSIEKPISIKEQSEGGDEIIGYIDMICDFELDDGSVVKVLMDHKTSSKKYPQNRIEESQQLSLYDYCEEVGVVGYIILMKPIKRPKRGERKGDEYVEVQIMIHTIPVDHQEEHLENAIEVLECIEGDYYPQQLDGCFAFGSMCEYTKICKKNVSNDSDLINMKEK